MNKKIINIAIIAHIDHGKTTLVNKLLEFTNNKNNIINNKNQLLDYNILEKERGITITSKILSIIWKNYKINIIDTPGHSDFSGEVERIMSMVDSVLLLVDATEGPMPQTKFVTKKAFNYNLNPIIVINKIDRSSERHNWVINQIFDLFINLNANEKQLDFPIIYTSAINGKAGLKHNKMHNNITPLIKCIIKNTKKKKINQNLPFLMQISQIEYNNYLGNIGIGKINQGNIHINQNVAVVNYKGIIKTINKINNIFIYSGIKYIKSKIGITGDIIAISGINNLFISDTICNPNHINFLPKLKIEKPIISMLFGVNTSPFASIEGKFITSRQIFKRLKKELLYNISLKVQKTDNSNIFIVSGRGELHISILIENMRREGFELSIFQPKVILRTINEKKYEPYEYIIINIKKKYQGIIMEEINYRKGKLQNITFNNNKINLEYIIPSRGLIGFRNYFLSITSSTGILNCNFSHYDKYLPNIIYKRKNGVLISNKTGKALSYALYNLQNRGKLFIQHGEKIYKGQIIGINNRKNDLIVNCLTGKKLTNMRASGNDETIYLTPIIKMSLEQCLSFINEDEIIEVTPKSIRLRKKNIKKLKI